MQKKRAYPLILLISILSIFLIGYSLFIEHREKPYDDYLFTVSIRVDGKELTIYPYQKYTDYYFFLPSYAQHSDAYIIKNKKHNISLNDTELSSQNPVSEFQNDVPYTIYDEKKDVGSLTIMYGSDIPSIFVETESGSLDKLKENQDHQEPASLVIVDDGHIDYNNSIEYITGRGNHSWGLGKKGWGFKLLEEASILGMASYDRWILTSNMFDDSMGLRNYIAYSMAKEIGMKETSDFRFVDVYINKEYQGTYILFERIGEGEDKLNIGDLDLLNDKSNKTIEIEKLNPIKEYKEDQQTLKNSYREFNTPSDISGGYILERNAIGKISKMDHYFTTSNEEVFVVRYPNFVNKDELDYIKEKVEAVDRALHDDNYIDPITNKKLNELVDLDSFALKYLVDEVTKNEGAGSTSCYYYKKQGVDILYAGPIWDYDKSLGRYAEWAIPEGIANATLYKYGNPTDWYDKLYYNEEAFELIKKYYQERVRPYLNAICEIQLEEQANIIRNSYKMNNIVWGEEFYKEEYYLPGHIIEHIGDLDYSVNYLKEWIMDRESFLDKEWGLRDEH